MRGIEIALPAVFDPKETRPRKGSLCEEQALDQLSDEMSRETGSEDITHRNKRKEPDHLAASTREGLPNGRREPRNALKMSPEDVASNVGLHVDGISLIAGSALLFGIGTEALP